MNCLLFRKIVLLVAVFISSVPVEAEQLMTATCGKLSGTKIKLVNGKPKTTSETKGGPIFFVDSESPQKLISLWKLNLFGKETTDKYEAAIVELSNEKLQAVERDINGLYSYTIFLKTGTLFYSHHRLQSLFDEEPTLLSFVGRCEVKIGR